MASTAFPSVIAAVMARAGVVLTGARVVRGRDISEDPGDVVMVGIQDITDEDWNSAGNFQQTMQSFGGGREETGTVNGLILATNGDDDQDAACSAACDYMATLAADVKADPTLGLTGFEYVVAELQSGDVNESQNRDGAAAVVSFSIAYKIRI
jgi:hypothetical protein